MTLDPETILRNVINWNCDEAVRCDNPNQAADRARYISNIKVCERQLVRIGAERPQ